MEMNNFMTTMPKATMSKAKADNSAGTGGLAKETGTGHKTEDSFGDILGQTGKIADSGSPVTADNESKLSDGETAATPRDPLAAALVATQQGSLATITELGGLVSESVGDTAEASEIGAIVANKGVGLSAAGFEKNSDAWPEIEKQLTLQSVLPQDVESQKQDRRLLDMLAGTAWVDDPSDDIQGNGETKPLGKTLVSGANVNKVALQTTTTTYLPGLNSDNGSQSDSAEIAVRDPRLLQSTPVAQAPTGNEGAVRNLWHEIPVASLARQTVPMPMSDENHSVIRSQRFAGNVFSENLSENTVDNLMLNKSTLWDARQHFGGGSFAESQNFGQEQRSAQDLGMRNGFLAIPAEELTEPNQIANSDTHNSPAPEISVAPNVSANQSGIQSSAIRTEEPAPLPQNDFDVPRQIVEQARLIRRGTDTEMVIRLKPEHLGNLTLRVSVTEAGAVNASFHSDNAQVRLIIENSLVQLKQELSEQGIKVDKVEVYTGLADGQMPQGQGQQSWQRGQGDGQVRNLNADLAAFEEAAAETTSVGTNLDSAEGVDYRV